MSSPDSSSRRYYYLRIAPSNPSTRYINRYVRYTGSGHNDIVLTEAHPVYLKFYMEDGKQLATHNDRTFGFVLSNEDLEDGTKSEASRRVEMLENQGGSGFYSDENDSEKLKWRTPEKDERTSAATAP